MRGRERIVTVAVGFALLAMASVSWGAGTPQDWIKRILDPATIGVTPFPGSKMNRKLTVDYLSKSDPPKRIAVYMAPLDQIAAASEHFAKTLHVKPAVTGAGSKFELHRFELSGGGDYPAKADGLTILISRSQWVDDKAQITMEYMPKE